MPLSRRSFLAAGTALLAAPLEAAADDKKPNSLEREVGITTGSFTRQLAAEPKKFTLLELIPLVREKLDMRVIDVYTPSLASFEPAYLDRVRAAAEKAGCVLTNLKMNQPGLDLGSADQQVRDKALAEYQRSIDAAARLGMRWARPAPTPKRPDLDRLAAACRQLADYAAERRIQLLIENNGWMSSEPNSVVKLVKAIGKNTAAAPDTGNWSSNEVRYEGLAKTFPLAATCDFKARDLEPDGTHKLYDLKKCFTIGWDAGFRGAWCLEHSHADLTTLLRELNLLKTWLRQWMAER